MTKQNIQWSIKAIEEFDQHHQLWDELNNSTFNSILLQSSFYADLLVAFGTGKEQLVIARINDTVVCCGIMCPAGKGSWQTFQPSQAPLGAWMFDPAAVKLENLTRSLQKALPGYCLVLGISQLDPDHSERPEDSGSVRTMDYIDTARILVEGTFEDYWAARGRNLRHNMKRQRNRLTKESIAIRLETLSTPEDMTRGLKDYGEMESKGWKADGGTAISLDNDQGKFYHSLLKRNASTGNAVIFRYFYNELMVATDLCIYDQNNIVILKTTHDETQKTTSPAFLMRQEYFEQFFNKQFMDGQVPSKIEFYGKLMDWHTKWSSEVRSMYHVNQYRWQLLAKTLGR